MKTIKIGPHYFDLNSNAPFYKERIELAKWLVSSKENILVLHCNDSRIVQDLFRYLTGKNYNSLEKSKRDKNYLRERYNLIYFMGIDAQKFCEENKNIKLSELTRGIKNNEGNYYPLLLLMSIDKYNQIINLDKNS